MSVEAETTEVGIWCLSHRRGRRIKKDHLLTDWLPGMHRDGCACSSVAWKLVEDRCLFKSKMRNARRSACYPKGCEKLRDGALLLTPILYNSDHRHLSLPFPHRDSTLP